MVVYNQLEPDYHNQAFHFCKKLWWTCTKFFMQVSCASLLQMFLACVSPA